MSNLNTTSAATESKEYVFDIDSVISSGEVIKPAEAKPMAAEVASVPAEEVDVEMSPIFKELAFPKLPELEKENRARLQMQSPNSLYFYWSIKNNPFQVLNRAFGGDSGSYSLVVKMKNMSRGTEEIHTVDTEGTWWFHVDANNEYCAEIGFYAPNRPYFRIMYSNTVATPRKTPSPRTASDADWTVTSDRFAQVLDVSGFKQDAFDVALAGDDWESSEHSTKSAFAQFLGKPGTTFEGISQEDLRYALFALAAGVSLETLRWSISPALFAILDANTEMLGGPNAFAALQDHFGLESDDAEEDEEEFGSAVFGASLINFPRRLRRKGRELTSPGSFEPLSSSNFQ
ncbi:MAG: DUF4912 domain-containing protein [Pyrinomonadaceae bacterium]